MNFSLMKIKIFVFPLIVFAMIAVYAKDNPAEYGSLLNYLNTKYQIIDEHQNYQIGYLEFSPIIYYGGVCKFDGNIRNCMTYHAITINCQEKWCRMYPDGHLGFRGSRIILEEACLLYELYYQNLDILTGKNEEYRIITSLKESGSNMLNYVALSLITQGNGQLYTEDDINEVIRVIENEHCSGKGEKSELSVKTVDWMEKNLRNSEDLSLAKTVIKSLYDEQKGLSGYYKKNQAWLKGEEKEIFQRK